jgi:hypothetical protein
MPLSHDAVCVTHGASLRAHSFVLADKTRAVYNMDHFLVPVATAYGEWDGVTKFGMRTHGSHSARTLHCTVFSL